jgi:hypothetical protein
MRATVARITVAVPRSSASRPATPVTGHHISPRTTNAVGGVVRLQLRLLTPSPPAALSPMATRERGPIASDKIRYL